EPIKPWLRSDPVPTSLVGLLLTGVWPTKVGTAPVNVVGKILPVDGTLTAPVGATATLAPALTTAGVIVIVPLELGTALLRSDRSWVLLETESAVPEPRRLFTAVVAPVETFAVTEANVGTGAAPFKPATGPPPRLAPK